MAHDAREEKWRGNKRMEWVTSKHHMTAEHRLAWAVQTLQADVHSSPASSRLNWRPRRFKWTRPFRGKTKSCFCACAITFQTQSNSRFPQVRERANKKNLLRHVYSLPAMTAQHHSTSNSACNLKRLPPSDCRLELCCCHLYGGRNEFVYVAEL
jgi:hypothetical protein